MDISIPPQLVGLGAIVVGVLVIVFAAPIGRFNERIANRFLPDSLRDAVLEAPLGLDMRRRNIAGGVFFIVFGIVFLGIVEVVLP